MRTFCSNEQDNWAALLAIAEFAYNNSKHSMTTLSPFYACYGFNPVIRFKAKDGLPEGRVLAIIERIKEIIKVREALVER